MRRVLLAYPLLCSAVFALGLLFVWALSGLPHHGHPIGAVLFQTSVTLLNPFGRVATWVDPLLQGRPEWLDVTVTAVLSLLLYGIADLLVQWRARRARHACRHVSRRGDTHRLSPPVMGIGALLLFLPANAVGQSPADAQFCDQLLEYPSRSPDARANLQAAARGADARAAFAQGCLAMADERWENAAAAFERAVVASKGSAVSHFWLGRAHAEQAQRANLLGRASFARKTRASFERAVQLDPGYIDARMGLMQYYLQAPGALGGSTEKAREQAREIRRLNPYRGGFVAVTLALRDKNPAGAVAVYEDLIVQFPDSVQPYYSLALLHGEQKRWDEAFRTIERLLSVQPGSLVAQYAIGRLAMESGQQLERGEQGFKRYIAGPAPKPGDPPLANAHWRLGALYERGGRSDLARAEYEAALRIDPRFEPAKNALARLR